MTLKELQELQKQTDEITILFLDKELELMQEREKLEMILKMI